jgi:hypothetical protein
MLACPCPLGVQGQTALIDRADLEQRPAEDIQAELVTAGPGFARSFLERVFACPGLFSPPGFSKCPVIKYSFGFVMGIRALMVIHHLGLSQ